MNLLLAKQIWGDNTRQVGGIMTLALIPARAGSKGIPNKNLTLLGNKPLLHYTIEAAKQANCIDSIVLSSDGEAILKYGRTQGIEVLQRPKELALDDTTSDKVVAHALQHYACENLILLQPTSPLRRARHIDEAFERFSKEGSDALISVAEYDNAILKAFVLDERGYLRGICNDTYPFMPRQKLPKTYKSNGAIYIVQTHAFLDNPSFLQPHTSYYVMDSTSSLDIDSPEDLDMAHTMVLRYTSIEVE